MKSTEIPIGTRFGHWIVIGPFERRIIGDGSSKNKNYLAMYPCRCDCGTERLVRAFKLLSNSKSCGCRSGEIKGEKATKHGQSTRKGRSRLYKIWDGMIQRCTNENRETSRLYREVQICPEWRNFTEFYRWAISNGYAENLTIDRKDGNRGYYPENCRWATTAVQARNKKTNQWLTAFGETKCVTDWSLDPRCQVTPSTIMHRLQVQGMSPEQAIISPRKSRKLAPKFKGNLVKSNQE
jgi:hypothetical protein